MMSYNSQTPYAAQPSRGMLLWVSLNARKQRASAARVSCWLHHACACHIASAAYSHAALAEKGQVWPLFKP